MRKTRFVIAGLGRIGIIYLDNLLQMHNLEVVAVMYGVSCFYPKQKEYQQEDLHILNMKEWRYTKLMSIMLCAVTILIYMLLGLN
jgi:uncharacterized sodium:solute symporter family permease YidK